MKLNKKPYSKSLRKERKIVYFLVIFLIICVMFPFFWLLQMSFKPDTDIFAFPPKFIFKPLWKSRTEALFKTKS